MSAAKSQKNRDIPAELQPYYDEPRTGTHTVARWLTRLLALIIFICLAVIFIRWAWHQTHTDTDTKGSSTTSQHADDDAKSGTHSSKPITLGGSSEGDESTTSTSDSDSSTTTENTSTAAAGNAASAAQAAGQAGSLVNTGPGQTLAVFIVSSICFVALYELRLQKQQR